MNKKVKGVHLDKRSNKWIAYINIDGIRKNLGSFDNYEDAVKARKDAEIKYNFVPVTKAPKFKHKNDLTQEMLKEIMEYNPETGIFTRRVRRGSSKIGDIAGTMDSYGYLVIRINDEMYKAHRLVFLYMNGKFPEDGLVTDHINQIKDDNRWENLRLVTNQENGKNCSMYKNNKAGQTGVHWHKSNKRWHATINVDGEPKHLGSFNTKEEAIAARKAAEIEYGFHENHGKLKQIKGE